MRKLFTLALTMLFVVALAGCGKKEQPKDPLEVFLEQMETEENCEMEMSMEVPMFGEVKVTAEVDGNKMHMGAFLFVGETYTEEVEGVTYQYAQDEEGNWIKSVQEDTTEESEFSAVEDLKYEDFTKGEDGKYTLKEDKTAAYEVDSMTLELTDDGAIMTMEKSEEGMVLSVTITISKIGGVSVTLPTEFTTAE